MLYAFLGHQEKLSTLELETLCHMKPTVVAPAIVSIPEEHGLLELADKLGGTMKIAKGVAIASKQDVPLKLFELIRAHEAKNVAISNYSDYEITQHDIHDLKESVVAERPVRFVSFETQGHELVMLRKKHVAEFNILPSEDGYIIAETVWIYDGLGFAARDRKKPYQDIKKGMLPVKLARIMVNLAVQGHTDKKVLDPFCGTGTVCAEALMVGCLAYGSDLDSNSVAGTKTNLEWFAHKYQFPLSNFRVLVSDASAVDTQFGPVDAVVTEPYMGPLLDARHTLPEAKIRNSARGLDKLYRGALRSWHKMLPPGGRVVMTLPEFKLNSRSISTISIDTISSLGYNLIASVPYSKPGVTVVRNITILEKLAN
jgi:tRNA G10  N-methylase Trm11